MPRASRFPPGGCVYDGLKRAVLRLPRGEEGDIVRSLSGNLEYSLFLLATPDDSKIHRGEQGFDRGQLELPLSLEELVNRRLG